MKNILYSFLIAFALLLTGCANAGKDQQVNANTLVTLNGNASTPSAKGQITTYKWKQIKGKKVRLSNKKIVSPTFTAPNVNKKKKLVFRLTTTETGGIYSPLKTRDYVIITVLPTTSTDVDTVKPVLTLNGDTNITLTLTVGDTYVDAGATATDNKDGDITDAIVVDNPVDTTTAGTYTITYTVSDAAGNEATATRTVTVVLPTDTTAPVITLNGGDVTLTVGETYTEEGATATDDRDGNVTVDINGTVNTTTAGIYTIVYTASDLAGNQASPVTRTVTVNALTNHAPTANDLSVTTSKNTSLDINVTVEDSDGDTLMYNLHTMPDHGTLTGELPNVTYHPNAEYVGTDYFTFSAMDGHLAESTEANVSITITDNTIGTSTLNGRVTDINGTGIFGAQVTVAGTTVTTDNNGSYSLSNVPAGERVLVNVTHPDYLANSRVTDVNTTDINLNITLDTPKATLTFDAAEGATVSQSNGASVELPVNGYIDANGTAYTGTVTVKMSYHAITTQEGRATFPGTFEGIEGNTTFPIQSYGFMNVELTDANGNPLNLDGESIATLTYPNDTSLNTPSTVPLWYYDEEQGYWVQEGEATNSGHYSTYVGTVTHFTSWNLDAKGPKAKFTGCVEDENGTRVSNARVQFKSINWDSYVVPTDINGDISVYALLSGKNLKFTAYKLIGPSYYYGEYPSPINLKEGENKILDTCIILKKRTVSYNTTIKIIGNVKYYNNQNYNYTPVLIVQGINSGLVYYLEENVPEGSFNINVPILNDDVEFRVSTPGCSHGKTFLLKPNTNLYNVETIDFIPVC